MLQYEVEDEDQVEEELKKEDFINFAKECLEDFFKGRFDPDGLVIEPDVLFTERNVTLVLNKDICTVMPSIYTALASRYRKENAKRKSKVPADVERMLKLLNECSRLGIPKCCAAGLLVVYVEICEGCKVDIA